MLTISPAVRIYLATDATDLRRLISADLGFSKADRDANVQRIGFIARLLSRNGVAVIVAAVSPFRAVRNQVREAQEARLSRCSLIVPLRS
jgi:adenylylsulfate kinase